MHDQNEVRAALEDQCRENPDPAQVLDIVERLDDKNTLLVLQAYVAIGDRERVRSLTSLMMAEGKLGHAFLGARFLGDHDALFSILCAEVESSQDGDLDMFINAYLGAKRRRFHAGLEQLRRDVGYPCAPVYPLSYALPLAHAFSCEYDAFVGIAGGGLFLSHVFRLYGAQVAIAGVHRNGRGATFRWLTEPPDIAGKKIAVIENDVFSGRTSRRAARELGAAGQLDLILSLPRSKLYAPKIPDAYDAVHYPSGFESLPCAVREFERRLG